MFSAIAERTEPVHLDEVIRHNHELDRDAAKLHPRGRRPGGPEPLPIRGAGHGRRERRGAPRGDGRGLVAVLLPRRGRADGGEAKRRGRALERHRARAGPIRRQAWAARRSRSAALPSLPAIRSSPAINDRAGGIYNRERWEVAARSTPSAGASSLTASTRRGASRSAPTTWSRTTLGGEAPALQHAYAVTTYCAQGTTVDRRLRDGRPVDGQAGVLRRHLAHPRADLPLRDSGDPGRAQRVRARRSRARRHRPRWRSGRARPRPDRRSRRGVTSRAGEAAHRRAGGEAGQAGHPGPL